MEICNRSFFTTAGDLFKSNKKFFTMSILSFNIKQSISISCISLPNILRTMLSHSSSFSFMRYPRESTVGKNKFDRDTYVL